ncbi:MAG: GIY-YIG nuclease family protein [Anaerolineales bacterium]|nr:GIY-YIG nuclease family protein [Anaerolineales bacterium]
MTYNLNKYRFQSIPQTSPNKAAMKKYYIYIMSSTSGTLYTGVTSDIEHRVHQHKHKLMDGFTKEYNVDRLAYYEETTDINVAIAREKEIKGWRRSKKISLIKSINPKWKDLAEDWFEEDSD